MNLRAIVPALSCVLLTAATASPEVAPDAGPKAESMPFIGPVPEERTKPPALAEWQYAPDIEGGLDAASPCKLRRVREWLRLRCAGENGYGMELLAGTPTEINLFNKVEEGSCHEVEESFPRTENCKTTVEVVFPIRRGDRRFFQFIRQGPNEYSWITGTVLALKVGATLSAAWVEDEPGQVVVMMGYGD